MTDLIVAGELQREEKERLARNSLQHGGGLPGTNSSRKILPAPAERFHKGGTGAVRTIMRISNAADVHGDVMACRVTHPPSEARGDRRQEGVGRKSLRLLDQPFPVPSEPRMASHAIEREGHPMGPQIAFLEHKGPDSAQRGAPPRRHLVRPAVAESQDVGDLLIAKEIIEECRP